MSRRSVRFRPWNVALSTRSATRRPPGCGGISELERPDYTGETGTAGTRDIRRPREAARPRHELEAPITRVRHAEPVTFPGPAGILEGLWGDPGTGMPPVVISHPHPGHGGTM